jgi:hypothetical protein
LIALIDRNKILKHAGRLLIGAACFIFVLWVLLAWKAYGHYQTGKAHQTGGRMLEAAREYQTAIGFYAPFNPWSRAGAQALQGMARDARGKDPALAFELEDRLGRSVHGIRWLFQPYRQILAALEDAPGDPMRDPNPWMFFLSLAGFVSGYGALFIPRKGALFRAVGFVGGLGVWSLALHFC